jgi:hypothetical protein
VGSPPCLAGEVAGKELAFARGRFELQLEVGTTGNEARGGVRRRRPLGVQSRCGLGRWRAIDGGGRWGVDL